MMLNPNSFVLSPFFFLFFLKFKENWFFFTRIFTKHPQPPFTAIVFVSVERTFMYFFYKQRA